MTEQEFLKQVWRPYDKITTAEGVPGKVLGVSFTTKSVRAYISGAPEWLPCDLIETHTTGKGADGDDVAFIEGLYNKVKNQATEIERLRNDNERLRTEKNLLAEKISKNYLSELLRAVNLIKQGLQEKKHKMEQIDSGIELINGALAKMEHAEETQINQEP